MKSQLPCLVVLLAACTSAVKEGETTNWVTKLAETEHGFGALREKECQDRGGIWYGTEDAEYAYCASVPSDGGIACADNYDCESFCRTLTSVEYGAKTSGVCHDSFEIVGCIQGVHHGHAEVILCVDRY